MDLHDVLKKAGRIVRRKTRKGRGPSSGLGKTSGRGTKGLGARSGAGVPPWYEGGATPTYRRFPKRGFSNRRFQSPIETVNVGALRRFDAGAAVGPDDFRKAGFTSGRGRVKILAKGALDRPLTVSAHRFSAAARAKIEAAGGKALRLA